MARNTAEVKVGRVGNNDQNFLCIYIGRGSPLGNPFVMSNEQERDRVCDLYEGWIEKKATEKGSPQRKEIKRLREVSRRGFRILLQCYCSPKRCHGDTIKRLIERKTL